jgi:hypothetical protein
MPLSLQGRKIPVFFPNISRAFRRKDGYNAESFFFQGFWPVKP